MSTITMTPEQLLKVFSLEKTAAKAHSFEDFVNYIRISLKEYIRAYEAEHKNEKIKDIYYLTMGTYEAEKRVDAESIAWFYMLSNPDAVLRFLDPSRRSVVDKFLRLDPAEYREGLYYNYEDMMEEFPCSENVAYCMIALWEMCLIFKDAERMQFNMEYLLLQSGDIEKAKKFYSYYRQYSKERAAADIERFLEKKMKSLQKMYPQGETEIRKRQFCIYWDLEQDDRRKDWTEINHLFFRKHSSVPEESAGLFYDYIYPSYWSKAFTGCYGFQDRIEIEGYGCSGMETAEYCRVENGEQYSYHDGGGGCRDITEISYAPGIAVPETLMRDKYYKGERIPECKGYWEVDGHVYLLNPLKMNGVYNFCTGMREWTLDGDETWKGIGVERQSEQK